MTLLNFNKLRMEAKDFVRHFIAQQVLIGSFKT